MKLEAVVEMTPTIMENGNSIKLTEEKMICASNCEDNTFCESVVALQEKQIMTCANNCEDSTVHMEVSSDVCDHTMLSKGSNEDVEVDIVNDVKFFEERVDESESRDMTESSSSFGSMDSELGNCAVSDDMEVESQIRDDHASLLRCDGFSDLFRIRKKKLTADWRKFVHRLSWRCKWAELQVRELRSQIFKYDREIAECLGKKQCLLEKQACKDVGMKSIPFLANQSVKLMKRKKRRRVEEAVDLASYTSSHCLLSYHATKKPAGVSAFLDDGLGNTDLNSGKKTPFGTDEFGLTGGWSYIKDNDSFESYLRKIDEAQLRVHQLRIRMEVVKKHVGKLTSNGNDPSTSCAQNSVLPHVDSEKAPLGSIYTTSNHPCEMNRVVPENAFSSHRGVTPLPDMVERTDQLQIEEKCKQIGDDILTYQQPMKEELSEIQSKKFPSSWKRENDQNGLDPSSSNQMQVTGEQPTAKTRSISRLITPKNKRKRGRRKARSSRWSRKSYG